MPRWFRRYLFEHSLEFHLFVSLALGLLFRVLCGYFVYGPQALDDFNHAVTPAYHMLYNMPLKLPGFRSELLVWILAGLMSLAAKLGFDTPLGELRACYMGLGVFSLAGLWGTYYWAREIHSKLFGGVALYLLAVFPMLPFISTRTFGEGIAATWVLLGFGLLEAERLSGRNRFKIFLLGFLALGMAAIFRYQAGLLFPSYWIALLFCKNRKALGAGVVAGILLIGIEGGIDLLSGRTFLETLKLYLADNNGGGARFGVTPWFNTWLLFLGILLAPVSLVFWSRVRSLWHRHWPWVSAVLFFVAAHSMIPHKEERFLYPVFGVEIWMLAWLWTAGAQLKWGKALFSPILFYVLVPLSVALCLINTQVGSVEPSAVVSSRYRHAIVWYDNVGDAIRHYSEYFLRPPIVVESVQPHSITARLIDQSIKAHPESEAVFVMTTDPAQANDLKGFAGLHTELAECADLESASSITDRILYSLNPKHNLRRAPTWYLICERRNHGLATNQ